MIYLSTTFVFLCSFLSYEKLMLNKAQEERQEIESKLEEIHQNHAAKIIQKAWRKHDKIVKSDAKHKGKKQKNQ